MNPRELILLTSAAMQLNALQRYQYVERTYPNSTEPEKRCIVCGKLRFHNNSFCSRECCVKYKNDTTKKDTESST